MGNGAPSRDWRRQMAAGEVGWLADGMSFRFRRPVYPGDTITCESTLRELDERGRAVAGAFHLTC